jgi:phosphohistidine phosphatase
VDVIFFRHGVAVDREDPKGKDADRPLTQEGAERVKLAARGLKSLQIDPGLVLSSPFVRARKTAELAKQELNLTIPLELTDELTPEAPPERLLARLKDVQEKFTVLCVGHEPHISSAVSFMISGKIAASIEIKKAAACCVRFAGPAKAGTGTLIWLLPAKILCRLRRE